LLYVSIRMKLTGFLIQHSARGNRAFDLETCEDTMQNIHFQKLD